MRVTFFSLREDEKQWIDQLLANRGIDVVCFNKPLVEIGIEHIPPSPIISVFGDDQLDEVLLSQLAEKGIKVILTRSTGVDHIDLKAAKKYEMKVANVPGYSPQAIAEFSVLLLLNLIRKYAQIRYKYYLRDFRLDGLLGEEIYQKKVVVLGTGQIGSAVAKIYLGFGAKVFGYDIVENSDLIQAGVQYVEFSQIGNIADIITIHLPLTDETRHLLDASFFRSLKRRPYIVNTGRGAIVHTASLIQALQQNQIRGYAADVYERERGLYFKNRMNDVITDSEWLQLNSFPNVILTQHLAFYTKRAVHTIIQTVVENIFRWIEGKSLWQELSLNN